MEVVSTLWAAMEATMALTAASAAMPNECFRHFSWLHFAMAWMRHEDLSRRHVATRHAFRPSPTPLPTPIAPSASHRLFSSAAHCAYVACAASIKPSSLVSLTFGLLQRYMDHEVPRAGACHIENNSQEVFIYCVCAFVCGASLLAAAGDSKK